MDKKAFSLITELAQGKKLMRDEYRYLIENNTPEAANFAAELAVEKRKEIYGNSVFIRGLIEISNICKNNCLYCGIRAGNSCADRYRLTRNEIMECCREGYSIGMRTFVLQGGEDPFFNDDTVCGITLGIKEEFPDCAVTLSLGEKSRESYKRLKDAGADRYLLRHETADCGHYSLLHPDDMSFENRMRCLYDLKETGFQVGCGFMVGSPHQTSEMLAKDLEFIADFSPDMCGIGPFIPHKDTPFGEYPPGTPELTCFLLSLIRLIKPNILLPATTALGTVSSDGRARGILAGANVVMPNLSPTSVRKKYMLYNGKVSDGAESAGSLAILKEQMNAIGYEVVTVRGDIIK
ncbi:MAG: [Clostridia bacterium]|nr:[FeFe] hydrogenase H-cluster radical SAM maturase HydE [Clostridia bacterium]